MGRYERKSRTGATAVFNVNYHWTRPCGVAPILFARRWTVYFRQRDYLADDFAYQLGFGQDLLDYLQSGSAGIAAIAPGAQTWTQFTELRIDRLLLHFQKEHFVEAEEPLIEFEEKIQEE